MPGSKEPNKEKVGKVSRQQVMEIVKLKSKDLNAANETAAFESWGYRTKHGN